MAIRSYKERLFKADIIFEDDSTKSVSFRLPKNTDLFTSSDDNVNVNLLMTYSNMSKDFDKPVEVELDDGSIKKVNTLKGLIDLGVVMDFANVSQAFVEASKKKAEEEQALIKK